MVSKTKTLARVGIFLSLLTLVPLITPLLGLNTRVSAEQLRDLVAQAGAFGPLAFVLLFVLAVVAQVPGFAFVLAAPSLFRLPIAWALCFVTSNVAVMLAFAVVRRFGGQPLAQIERPFLRKLFAQLDSNPVRTVALLRALTAMFPPVTSGLALTQVSARDHAIGTVLGMALPITALTFFAETLVALGR